MIFVNIRIVLSLFYMLLFRFLMFFFKYYYMVYDCVVIVNSSLCNVFVIFYVLNICL